MNIIVFIFLSYRVSVDCTTVNLKEQYANIFHVSSCSNVRLFDTKFISANATFILSYFRTFFRILHPTHFKLSADSTFMQQLRCFPWNSMSDTASWATLLVLLQGLCSVKQHIWWRYCESGHQLHKSVHHCVARCLPIYIKLATQISDAWPVPSFADHNLNASLCQLHCTFTDMLFWT